MIKSVLCCEKLLPVVCSSGVKYFVHFGPEIIGTYDYDFKTIVWYLMGWKKKLLLNGWINIFERNKKS